MISRCHDQDKKSTLDLFKCTYKIKIIGKMHLVFVHVCQGRRNNFQFGGASTDTQSLSCSHANTELQAPLITSGGVHNIAHVHMDIDSIPYGNGIGNFDSLLYICLIDPRLEFVNTFTCEKLHTFRTCS